jgi:hypothetical protein
MSEGQLLKILKSFTVVIPSCLTRSIYRERNIRTFEETEVEQKSLLLRSLFDWMKTTGIFASSFFFFW